MKKILLTLIFLIFFSSIIIADNALYIYRNDGYFNAFLDNDIDSISYSTIDTSGIEHQHHVTQLVYTPDSLYKIPLSAIDSIAFTERPAPLIKSDVFYLTSDHLPYITDINELTISFLSSTPTELLPSQGSVVVSNVYEGILINGFAGRVSTITSNQDNIIFDCNEISITDIYERLILTGTMKSTNSTDPETYSLISSSNTYNFEFPELNKDFEDPENGTITFSDTPQAHISYTIFIEKGYHPIISMFLFHTHKLNANLNRSGEYENAFGPYWLIDLPIRIINTPIYAKFKLGTFFNVTGKMELNIDIPCTIGFVNGFSYNEKGFTKVNRLTKCENETPTGDIDMNGAITAGLAAEISMGLITEKLFSITGEIRGGVQLEADYKLKDFDLTTLTQNGAVYNLLKDSKIRLNRYISVNCGYNLIGFEGEIESEGLKLPYEDTTNLKEWYLLPTFSEPEYTIKDVYGTEAVVVSTTAERDLLMPVKVGVAFHNNQDNYIIETQKSDTEYHTQSEYPLKTINGTFYPSDYCEKYAAYPVIEVLGCELRATPEIDFVIKAEDESVAGEAVDLGLPSGLKWASCNVGATSPEEYGDRYAWGEIEEKDDSDYTEDNYKFILYGMGESSIIALNEWGDSIRLYNIQGTQYDVARMKWGGKWRMPTVEDFVELQNNCTWEWDFYNDVSVCKITGPNGNYIYLPFTGRATDGILEGTDEHGFYWTSIFDGAFAACHSVYICRKDQPLVSIYGYDSSYNGLSVRPVQ